MAVNMIYGLCKKIITKDNYDKTELLNKIDVYFLNKRITEEEYKELISLIGV
jgi:hypothetical protein